MSTKKQSTEAEPIKAPTFTKNQLIKSKKYRYIADLIAVMLDDEKEYSINEVDARIKNFMKGRVS